MDKVIIVNAVPLNNGDAALVFALESQLLELGYSVKIATFEIERVNKLYPNGKFIPDILDNSIFKKKFLNNGIVKAIIIPFLFLLSKEYSRSDYIRAPGGYVNSYYGFFGKIYLYLVAKLFGKKTIVYSQSIGPLNHKDTKIFKFFSKYVDLLLVRDEQSYSLCSKILSVKEIENRIVKSKDAAFLFPPKRIKAIKGKRAAISVRYWKHDNRSSQKFNDLIVGLVGYLVENGFSVDFLSTCQGIEGYVDDSVKAKQIVEQLSDKYQRHTRVIDGYYQLDELSLKLRSYDLIVGTRLHMCILSMLNGVPAFNISYEFKGLECYKYLNIESFSVDYNASPDFAIEKLDEFIFNFSNEDQSRQLSNVILEVHQSMLNQLREIMINHKLIS